MIYQEVGWEDVAAVLYNRGIPLFYAEQYPFGTDPDPHDTDYYPDGPPQHPEVTVPHPVFRNTSFGRKLQHLASGGDTAAAIARGAILQHEDGGVDLTPLHVLADYFDENPHHPAARMAHWRTLPDYVAGHLPNPDGGFHLYASRNRDEYLRMGAELRQRGHPDRAEVFEERAGRHPADRFAENVEYISKNYGVPQHVAKALLDDPEEGQRIASYESYAPRPGEEEDSITRAMANYHRWQGSYAHVLHRAHVDVMAQGPEANKRGHDAWFMNGFHEPPKIDRRGSLIRPEGG